MPIKLFHSPLSWKYQEIWILYTISLQIIYLILSNQLDIDQTLFLTIGFLDLDLLLGFFYLIPMTVHVLKTKFSNSRWLTVIHNVQENIHWKSAGHQDWLLRTRHVNEHCDHFLQFLHFSFHSLHSTDLDSSGLKNHLLGMTFTSLWKHRDL